MGDFNIDLLKLRKINTLMMFLNQMFSSSFYPLISRPTRITSRSAALFDNIFVKGDVTRDNLQQRCFAQQCCAKHRSTCNMVSGTIFCATFYSATRCEFLKPSQKLATQDDEYSESWLVLQGRRRFFAQRLPRILAASDFARNLTSPGKSQGTWLVNKQNAVCC